MRAKENKGLFEMKKLFAVMMLLPLMAVANVTTIDGIGWNYTIENGEARLESVTPSNAIGKVAVPLLFGGCPVTRIGRHEFRSGFGCRVFGRCTNLTEVVISSNVVSIGDSAFFGCSGLKKVVIPPSVTNIGRCAFAGCRRLMTFDVNTENQKYSSRNGLLCSKDGSILVFGTNGDVMIPHEVKSIGDYAFRGCEELRTVVMPTGVKKIGNSAFQGCIELKSVDIPSSVTSIGSYAFTGCKNLMSFTVDDDNTKYSSRNGLLCSKDGATVVFGVNGDVDIPPSVKRIGPAAFYGCKGLKSVIIPEGVVHFGYYAFRDCDGLAEIKIPESVTSTDVQAFYDCDGLTSITIPAHLNDIGDAAFDCCRGLTSFVVDAKNQNYSSRNGLLCSKDGSVLISGVNGDVTIPQTVRTIGENAFSDREGLTSVMIPVGVTSIGEDAFFNCCGLTSVTIPPSVRSLARRAFYACSGLKSVTLPDGIDIGASAFEECGLKSVEIPSSMKSIPENLFAGCRELQSVKIPFATTHIGDEAFCCCDGLTSVTIPTSVTSIGKGSFYRCAGLKSVEIPSSVTSIGNGAFGRTPFYQSMPDGPIILGGGVLCKYKGECPPSVTIPPNVTSIGECSFMDCSNLTSMTISSAVTNVDGRAFVRCQKLKSVSVVMKTGNTEKMTFDEWFSPWKNVVAQRLKKCEILINEHFKKDAKIYLCLFSASWCGPCRKEMPRIAAIYAEALISDPNIELVHFSWDEDVGKALDWAKEVGAKFPVIKFKDGNPLDLRPDGVPHLFIVKADGTLVEHGHPSKIFTKEKIGKYLGEKSKLAWEEIEKNDKKWTYEVIRGGIVLGGKRGRGRRQRGGVSTAVSKDTAGELIIPANIHGKPVRGISEGAFCGCRKITIITIPPSVTSVGAQAFDDCRSLKSFSVDPANPVYCSKNGLLCSKDGLCVLAGVNGDVVIPEGVTAINREAFRGCTALASVTIPASVTNIGESAFAQCGWLASVTMRGERPSAPEGVFKSANRDLTVYAQANSSSWKGMTRWQGAPLVLDGEERIDGYTWKYSIMNGLATIAARTKWKWHAWHFGCAVSPQPSGAVTIPSKLGDTVVTSISVGAFEGCSNLTSVTIPASITNIGTGIRLIFQRDEYPERYAFENCVKLDTFNVEHGNRVYASNGGLLCSRDGHTLICGVGGDVKIPSNVTSIAGGAFRTCSNLTRVTIPSSVTNIGVSAFSGCSRLMEIDVEKGCSKYASHGGVLYTKDMHHLVSCPGGLASVTIMPSVTHIEKFAFSHCVGLSSITIPPSVTSVGMMAFNDCTNLKDITIPSTLTNVVNQAVGRCPSLGVVNIVQDGSVKAVSFEDFRKSHTPTNRSLLNRRRLRRK